MLAEYQGSGSSGCTLPIANPDSESDRALLLEEIAHRGYRFPGNAAGWRVVNHEWEPSNGNTTVAGRKVAGIIRVRTSGTALANGDTGPEHSTAIYVYGEKARPNRIQVELTPDLHRELDEYCERHGATASRAIRLALRSWLDAAGASREEGDRDAAR